MATSDPKSALDRALERYRERVGAEHWRGSDEILFRAAWNEGAAERDRQLGAEVQQLREQLADKALVLERYAALKSLFETDAQTCREALAEVDHLRDVLDLVAKYADTYGHDLIPHGHDSYGEGVRAAKRTIKNLLAHKAAKKGTTR